MLCAKNAHECAVSPSGASTPIAKRKINVFVWHHPTLAGNVARGLRRLNPSGCECGHGSSITTLEHDYFAVHVGIYFPEQELV